MRACSSCAPFREPGGDDKAGALSAPLRRSPGDDGARAGAGLGAAAGLLGGATGLGTAVPVLLSEGLGAAGEVLAACFAAWLRIQTFRCSRLRPSGMSGGAARADMTTR